MFLRKLGKRGVAMTEYAILLAFVAAIGAPLHRIMVLLHLLRMP